jgi:hypothetical protein
MREKQGTPTNAQNTLTAGGGDQHVVVVRHKLLDQLSSRCWIDATHTSS